MAFALFCVGWRMHGGQLAREIRARPRRLRSVMEEGLRILARGRNVGGVEGAVVRLTLPLCDGELG